MMANACPLTDECRSGRSDTWLLHAAVVPFPLSLHVRAALGCGTGGAWAAGGLGRTGGSATAGRSRQPSTRTGGRRRRARTTAGRGTAPAPQRRRTAAAPQWAPVPLAAAGGARCRRLLLRVSGRSRYTAGGVARTPVDAERAGADRMQDLIIGCSVIAVTQTPADYRLSAERNAVI